MQDSFLFPLSAMGSAHTLTVTNIRASGPKTRSTVKGLTTFQTAIFTTAIGKLIVLAGEDRAPMRMGTNMSEIGRWANFFSLDTFILSFFFFSLTFFKKI